MRIVFMGTPAFSIPSLERLVQSEHQIVAVYTQQDRPAGRGRGLAPSPMKRAALEYGLPVVQPIRLREASEVDHLAKLEPEVIVVAAFGQLLPQTVLDIPPFGCLNVHPSLLPRYRGASPIAAAILAGDEKTGVTIMLLDAGMDSGPLLTQAIVPIEPEDTAGSLGARLAQEGARLLLETLPKWCQGEISPQPQDESRATYTHPLAKGEGEIDWNLSAVEVWRRVRAFYPWPGCFTRWQGKLLKVLESLPIAAEKDTTPGRVVALASRLGAVIGVETGDGILGLVQLQLEGKQAMSAAEFGHGHKDFIGTLLPS